MAAVIMIVGAAGSAGTVVLVPIVFRFAHAVLARDANAVDD